MSDTVMTSFSAPAIGNRAIRLRVIAPGRQGRLCAYLRGVPLGEAVLLAEGAEQIDLPVERLPNVKLPSEIRIGWEDGSDACDPLILQTEEQALELAGPGELVDIEATFAEGRVRGTARNPVNGITVPTLEGRINGHIRRAVRTRIVSASPQGGAVVAFDMAVDPADFSAEGGVIEVLFAPSMQPLWRHALAPAEGEQASAVRALRQASRIENTARGLIADAETRFGKKLDRQNQLIEDITTYLLALVHDRASSTSNSADHPDRSLAKALMAKADADKGNNEAGLQGIVDAASPFMGQGWSRVDRGAAIASAATVLNPSPERPVARIVLTATSGSAPALAGLTAWLDAQRVSIAPLAVDAAPCSIVITPECEKGQPAVCAAVLTLVADKRHDPVVVQDVRFIYADAL